MIGLTLATIEVRFPATATQIAQYVHDQWNRTSENFKKRQQRPNRAGSFWILKELNYWFGKWYVRGSLVIALIMLMPFLVGFGDLPLAAILSLSLDATLPWVLLVSSVVLGLWAATKWVEGREVGTLGIIIAGFGVLGEAYQFTALALV